uniref:Uncharacterized protein n=1 Tax=Proboscia inermis TaxID=420281 RepID=A0A7S0C0J6_9STRA
MADEKYDDGVPVFPWASTVGAICTACTTLILFGTATFAIYYMEQVSSSRIDEINAIVTDEEVQIADERESYGKEVYAQATKWSVVPFRQKIVLVSSLTYAIASCYMVFLFPEYCFVEFGLTSTIERDLNGNFLNLIQPMGILSCALLAISCSLLAIFLHWSKRKTADTLKRIVDENSSGLELGVARVRNTSEYSPLRVNDET